MWPFYVCYPFCHDDENKSSLCSHSPQPTAHKSTWTQYYLVVVILYSNKLHFYITSSSIIITLGNIMNEPNATLYVSNIDWKIKKPILKRALHTLFSRHGKVCKKRWVHGGTDDSHVKMNDTSWWMYHIFGFFIFGYYYLLFLFIQ